MRSPRASCCAPFRSSEDSTLRAPSAATFERLAPRADLRREAALERVDERAREIGGLLESIGRLAREPDREHEIDIARELRRELGGTRRPRVHDAIQGLRDLAG